MRTAMHTPLRTLFCLAVASGLAVTAACTTAKTSKRMDEWVRLFDGATLDGWVATGDQGAWAASGGEIRIIRPGRGGWLRTERMYRDFELRLDFLVPSNGNSGVGLRGASTGDPAFTGFEVQILDSFGQEPSLTNCGAVYDAIAPYEMAVNPAGEWNTYEIRVQGDTITVQLNGTTILENEKLDERGFIHTPDRPWPLDRRLPTGYIALQDHGDRVRFRNIWIRDHSPDPDPGDYRPIIDADLATWERRDGAAWRVEDGVLIGEGGPGHLFHREMHDDVELRTFVMINERGNSGVYVRTVPNPAPGNPWPVGYEAQVDNHDPKNFTGGIYDKVTARELITRDGAWFDYRVKVVGDRVRTWINGEPMVDTRLDDFSSGRIALQGHHPGNVVKYRDLQVRDPSAD